MPNPPGLSTGPACRLAGKYPPNASCLDAVPIWETYVGTAYYQLEAYPYGIVQECRWQVRLGNFDRGRVVARFRSGKQPSK